jgi:type IV secretory pathway TrbF-like protein
MNKTTTDPYIQKRKEYDEITHNINASKRNWQVIAYIVSVALILSIGCNYYTVSRAHVIPYIVQVDDLGRAIATTEGKESSVTDEKFIKAFVYQYIDNARSIVSDPDSLTKNIGLVYSESIKSVQINFLDPFYKDDDPFVYAQKKGTRHIEPIIFLREGENTYSVEWREIDRDYENQVLGESHYKALVSVVQIPNTSEDKYRENPLNPFGFYVTSLSWAKLM